MPNRRPSPTTVIACLALFFAVAGGSAIALQGRNSVDSGDIKPKAVKTSDIANNAVTTKKIKNNHVRAADIQNDAVGAGEIRNGQVGDPELGEAEAVHKLGASGQTPFSNGGQGDCLWQKFVPTPPSPDFLSDPGFYKNPYGEVNLIGALTSLDGPGGDAACDGDDIADSTLFILPAGYRPPNAVLMSAIMYDGTVTEPNQLLVIGSSDLVVGPTTIPAGSVIALAIPADDGNQIVLDGLEFRAAGPGNTARREPVQATGSLAEILDGVLGD